MIVRDKVQIDGRELIVETGRVARQAGGSAYLQMGDSVVLVTACCADNQRDVGFLPLSCDYVERTFAAGKIPGGFFKREGRPTNIETLTSRLIDRPCRPLFPKGFTNEIQVIATVLSADREHATDVLAVCGASIALTISDVPWAGPLATARVGLVDGAYVLYPTYSELERSQLDIVVAVSKEAIVMVEGEAREVDEKALVDAFFYAYEKLQPVIAMQERLRESVGRPKRPFTPPVIDPAFAERARELAAGGVAETCGIADKKARGRKFRETVEAAAKALDPEGKDPKAARKVEEIVDGMFQKAMRARILAEGRRVDGRGPGEIRPITCEVGILPRVHGAGLFTRGETQAVVATTLGTKADEQRIDDLLGERFKRFLLHYNFPPYSVGEVKMLRGPSRREIGHGNLAERSLNPVIPEQEGFPYTIRVVSEVLESNGSSSMATVCGATLSLMDAGVPIKAPVAGIAMGLILEEGSGRSVILSDIVGDEDHLGDMDFKIAGTRKGITALQMDIKVAGVTREIVTAALGQARDGRSFILGRMLDTLPNYRAELSMYAPRVTTIKIKPDKIREIIGPGGKTIRGLQEQTGASIEIDDDGTVNIYTPNKESLDKAIALITEMVREAEVGVVYDGTVRTVKDFGAFVEIIPGVDGLVHISELAPFKVRTVEDVCREGDTLRVRCIGIDANGKIRLTHKEFYEGSKNDGKPGR